MARSSTSTPAKYLAALPAARRKVVAAVRKVILANLPAGYRESVNFGMLSYEVPLERYPKTYNGQPLICAALAAQKNYYALHLMCVYARAGLERELRSAFTDAGNRLDTGKACIRFRGLEDLPLGDLGRLIAATPVRDFIEIYEGSRKQPAGRRKPR